MLTYIHNDGKGDPGQHRFFMSVYMSAQIIYVGIRLTCSMLTKAILSAKVIHVGIHVQCWHR